MKSDYSHRLLHKWKDLTSGSANRQIFGAVIIVGFLTVFVKFTAMFKELIVASTFGINDELDAFLIALMVPSFVSIVLSNSFNSSFIPVYIRVREQEGLKAAKKLFSGATLWAVGILSSITLLVLLCAPLYLPLLASGFNSQKLDTTYHLLYAIAPFTLLSGITAILSDVLNAGEKFAISSVLPIITPTLTIILLLNASSLGVFALTWGLVCGSMLEMLILASVLHKQGLLLVPRWYGFDSHMQSFIRQYFPMIAGALLICSAGIVDQSMAAMLSPGSVAALNFGTRIITSILSLLTIALSTAIIPYFSKMVASEDWQGIGHTFNKYLQLIFVTILPLMILIILSSETITRILFQRGSFSLDDTILVSRMQSYSALQMPFYIANILGIRLISSMQQSKILMHLFGLSFIVNIFGNYVFMQWMGIEGIALSTSCVYIFSFIYIYVCASKKIKQEYLINKFE
jgi:putative peptidoglycan lipid II flippase